MAVHTEVEKDYIMAARLDGANEFYLLWNSIFPNLLTVIAAEVTFALSIAILDITALGFLGLVLKRQAVNGAQYSVMRPSYFTWRHGPLFFQDLRFCVLLLW
ncbi:peptide transport system permease protein SapC [Vibrio maritimus]|uniref:Peptide transport system permease protein SapC n=1 Tax=Vibrio maritimus TaxID=990268 RepID=A0A090T4W5_9VIBR|nr:peptide transport system permease protein SapC [Vibrio maritimus]